MYPIAAGLVFIFFYFNIGMGSLTIDLLPDIVGYGLIAYNSYKLRGRSYSFSKLVWLGAVMGVYATVVHLAAPTGFLAFILSALETGGIIWIIKLLVSGVSEIEDAEGRPLRSGALERWRYPLIAAYAAVFACNVALEFIAGIGFFALLIVFAWAVISVIFTVCFFRTASRYRKRDDGGNGGKKVIRGPLPPHVD